MTVTQKELLLGTVRACEEEMEEARGFLHTASLNRNAAIKGLRRTMTVAQLAEQLGVTRAAIYKALK